MAVNNGRHERPSCHRGQVTGESFIGGGEGLLVLHMWEIRRAAFLRRLAQGERICAKEVHCRKERGRVAVPVQAHGECPFL
jgi:hypothetical protein